MKRILFSTVVILAVVLTSCGTLEVTLEDPSRPTPIASDSSTMGPASLTMDSTSEEIRQTLLDSPFRWRTIFMDAQVTSTTEPSRRVQVWVDQPALSVRVLSGPSNESAQTFRVADGRSLLDLNIATGVSNLSPFFDGSLPIPYTPAPAGNTGGVAEPHPLSTSVDSAMGVLIFPSDIAQNEGTFRPVGMEVVAYHLCLIVDWTYVKNTLPSYRAWVDVSTGVFLRYEQFEKSGGTDVLSDVTVTRLDYDLAFNSDLFNVSVSAMPNFSADPLAAATVSTEPGEFVETDPLGSVYAFVADNSFPVRAMRLVRLPASCVTGDKDCPSAEEIKTPAALTASLQPLVWSPTRNEAAWAYPITPDQRIWTLYIFHPRDNSWTELASYDRYFDPPMWSHDGNWLAFRLQDGNGGSEIYAIRRDGTDMKILTDSKNLPNQGEGYVMDSWLGESVIFRSALPVEADTLYLMRVEDESVQPLFNMTLNKSPFAESPDETTLAYVESEGGSSKQVVKTITPDGKTFRDMATFTSGSILGLAWSPDGKQLAFSVRTDTTSSIYIIDSDGRNMRQVYTSATDTQFVFSPDSRFIVVQTIDGTGQHLYSIRLSTLAVRLVQVPGIALNEAWMLPTWVK